MERKLTLALAATILSLTSPAFANQAAASSTAQAPPPNIQKNIDKSSPKVSEMIRKAGEGPVIYMQILLSVLLP